MWKIEGKKKIKRRKALILELDLPAKHAEVTYFKSGHFGGLLKAIWNFAVSIFSPLDSGDIDEHKNKSPIVYGQSQPKFLTRSQPIKIKPHSSHRQERDPRRFLFWLSSLKSSS